ncbi:MAG TPA: DUF1080 domain-containing protein [Verrucomicrobiae bacterium]
MKLYKTLCASTALAAVMALPLFAEDNTLTDAEKAAGWQLLFNGTNFDGWHVFKSDGMGQGWAIVNGAMSKVQGGQDIVTTAKYDWFELELDYMISEGGNSGVMYHVTDAGPTIWWTGPEFQLEDDYPPEDAGWICGWLYGLYKPAIDPATGKPIEATKPSPQWNHIRLVVAPPPQKCEHYVNGVKYFDYVLHSDDFNSRVAHSKFSKMKGFAESDSGYIGLQGNHPGEVSFKNVKIRPIKQ